MDSTVVQSSPEAPYGPIEELRAGVDWLSCSLPIKVEQHWTWANECVLILEEIAHDGHAIGPRGLMGYRGVAAGASFTGRRDDGSYLQLAGAYAEQYYRRIIRGDLSVSRLDLAVTVKFETMPGQLGEDAFRGAIESARSLSTGRARRVWYMSGNDGGYTLYIGAPSSVQRGRLYNKEIQADVPEYARCWRYEVVYRNNLALECCEVLSSVQENHSGLLILSLVGQWYLSRGVQPPWDSASAKAVLPVEKKSPSDAERKLSWMAKQVKPAVRWLVEHGYEAEMRSALGLEE